MCNAYNVTTNVEAIIQAVKGWKARQNVKNQPWLPGIYPNYSAPIMRLDDGELELTEALWGMPTPPQFNVNSKGEPLAYDRGVTNIRNTNSPHWRRWLGQAHRCLVPFTTFSEPDEKHKNHFFRFTDDREVAFMAGICAPLTRQIKKSDPAPTEGLFYGFLTTSPNAAVAPIHAKAMPAILTEEAEFHAWLTADWSIAKELQRPLADGMLISAPAEDRNKEQSSLL